MNLGKVIGLERYRRRTRGLLDKPFGWTGAFSYLGTWPGDHLSLTEAMAGSWLGCPPSSRKVPISCGCIVFNGALGVGVQMHPSLVEGEDAPCELVARFIEEVSSDDRAADVATLGFTPWPSVIESSVTSRPVPF
jgi:hypothetical protein